MADGEVLGNVSIEVAQNGEVAEVVSIEVAQNGEVQATASINGAQNGEVTADSSVEVAQTGEVQVAASIEAHFPGEVQIAASMQCAVLIALDDLDENGADLTDHVPNFGFTTWEEEVAGHYVGVSNGFENQDVFKHARGGQNLSVFDNYRIYCDMRRGSVDLDGEVGLLLLNNNGAQAIGSEEHLAVGWRRVGSTFVELVLFRRNAAQQSLQTEIAGSNISYGAGDELRFIYEMKWPIFRCFTAPVGQNSPKTFIGSVALTGEVRPSARFGIEGGASGASATLFGVGVTGEFALYQLGPEQNNIVQITASMAVEQKPGEVDADASIEVAQNAQVIVDASINASVHSQVTADASINASQNALIPLIVSIFVAQNGTVQVTASLAADIGGRVTVNATLVASQNGAVTVVALIGVQQRIAGQVTADGSINTSQNNQIQIVATVQAVSLGATQEVVTIVVSQNAQVTVPVFISVIQAGGEVQIVASIHASQNAEVVANASIQTQVFIILDGQAQAAASMEADHHLGLEDRSGAVKQAYIPNSGRFVLRNGTLFIVDNETLRARQRPPEGFGWELDLFSNPPGELIVKTDKPGSVPLQYKIDRDGGEFDMGVLRIEIPDDWPKV